MHFISEFNDKFLNFSEEYLTGSVMAILLLVFGFFAVLFITKIFRRRFLKFFKVNSVFAELTGRDKALFDLEKWLARTFFVVLLLLLVYVAAQASGVESLYYLSSDALAWFNKVFGIIFKALLPVTLALVFSYLAKTGVNWLGQRFNLDQRVGSQIDAGDAVSFSLTKSLSEIAYGIVFLYFLPEILRGIGLEQLSAPITKMFEEVVVFFPRLVAATVIIFLCWFVAKILRQTLESLMVSLGVDTAVQKVFGDNVLSSVKLSKVVPTILYVVILMVASIEALKKIQLENITGPLERLLQSTFDWLPAVVFAVALVFISIYIGGHVSRFVAGILKDMGFDGIYSQMGLSDIKTGSKTPSEIIGFLAAATIVVMATLQALESLELDGLYGILDSLIYHFGNIAVAVLVFGIGLYVSRTVANWVLQVTSVSYAQFLSLAARVVILIITGAMALQQIGIADEIVTIAFALAFGSIALGVAIALGLGGKASAEELVKDFVSKFKS